VQARDELRARDALFPAACGVAHCMLAALQGAAGSSSAAGAGAGAGGLAQDGEVRQALLAVLSLAGAAAGAAADVAARTGRLPLVPQRRGPGGGSEMVPTGAALKGFFEGHWGYGAQEGRRLRAAADWALAGCVYHAAAAGGGGSGGGGGSEAMAPGRERWVAVVEGRAGLAPTSLRDLAAAKEACVRPLLATGHAGAAFELSEQYLHFPGTPMTHLFSPLYPASFYPHSVYAVIYSPTRLFSSPTPLLSLLPLPHTVDKQA
jgi:hypothetical protein